MYSSRALFDVRGSTAPCWALLEPTGFRDTLGTAMLGPPESSLATSRCCRRAADAAIFKHFRLRLLAFGFHAAL